MGPAPNVKMLQNFVCFLLMSSGDQKSHHVTNTSVPWASQQASPPQTCLKQTKHASGLGALSHYNTMLGHSKILWAFWRFPLILKASLSRPTIIEVWMDMASKKSFAFTKIAALLLHWKYTHLQASCLTNTRFWKQSNYYDYYYASVVFFPSRQFFVLGTKLWRNVNFK